MKKTCIWRIEIDQGRDEYYNTECGQTHFFIVGGVKDNSYKFCPYCGGRIIAKKKKEKVRYSVLGWTGEIINEDSIKIIKICKCRERAFKAKEKFENENKNNHAYIDKISKG